MVRNRRPGQDQEIDISRQTRTTQSIQVDNELDARIKPTVATNIVVLSKQARNVPVTTVLHILRSSRG